LPRFHIYLDVMERTIKIVLSILLLLCLADMPYGFYQFLRFVSCIEFVILVLNSNRKGNETQTIVFVVLALLFQPFVKISLGRTLWNIVDVVVAVGLIVSLLADPLAKGSNKTQN
jgi:uncharacterized protein DUF6804